MYRSLRSWRNKWRVELYLRPRASHCQPPTKEPISEPNTKIDAGEALCHGWDLTLKVTTNGCFN